jgi:hypothetical protein
VPPHAAAGNTKFAWFVAAADFDKANAPSDASSQIAGHGTALSAQTFGWQSSLAVVQEAIDAHGPFDGLLAFSQGCAMATFVLALQQIRAKATQISASSGTSTEAPRGAASRSIRRDNKVGSEDNCDPSESIGNVTPTSLKVVPEHQWLEAAASSIDRSEGSLRTAPGHEWLTTSAMLSTWNFSFVMLCSGHLGGSPEVAAALQASGPLRTKALHVFGVSQKDRQVNEAQSRALVECYCDWEVMEHDNGHVVPSSRMHAKKYLEFFRSALAADGPTVLEGLLEKRKVSNESIGSGCREAPLGS